MTGDLDMDSNDILNVILAIAAYPNALLHDGSRLTTNHFRIGFPYELNFEAYEDALGDDYWARIIWDDDLWAFFLKDTDDYLVDLNILGLYINEDIQATDDVFFRAKPEDGSRIGFRLWAEGAGISIIDGYSNAVRELSRVDFNIPDATASRRVARMINGAFNLERAGDITGLAGKILDFPLFKVGGVAGVDGTFTTVDGKTVTVTKGLITSIV